MRSKKGKSGQQCCYKFSSDKKKLTLIRSGKEAGTPDRVKAGGFGHISHDVKTYELAKSLGRISDYLSVRPPSQGGGKCTQ